jgi:hypothetical protein
MIEHKILMATTNSNVYRRVTNNDGFDQEHGEDRFWCSLDYSPTADIDNIDEYDMDLISFSSEQEADEECKLYIPVSQTMKFEDTIARYIKHNKQIGERELFVVPTSVDDSLKSQILVLAGKGENESIYLWFYNYSEISEITSLDFIPGSPYDIWSYSIEDEIFSKDFIIEY